MAKNEKSGTKGTYIKKAKKRRPHQHTKSRGMRSGLTGRYAA